MFKDTNVQQLLSPRHRGRDQFYGETLGIDVVEPPKGCELHIAAARRCSSILRHQTAPKHTSSTSR